MSEKKKKRFFASHAKSSAALISLGIHAVLLIVAISFVAVTVITKDEQSFEAKPPVKRPKMKLKTLQAPVKMEKKRIQKPKLRKRIVVKPKLNQPVPDIKMPEITGVKGGMGSAAGGLGGGAGIGFTMPEINIFGVKGKGEKIFIILDSSPAIMVDQMGGIPAYTLIKNELVKILGNLNSTVLFNIAVYEVGTSKVLFPQMVPATDANVAKVKTWLDPLNSVSKGMGDRDYGIRTLGRVDGSQGIRGNYNVGKLETQREWVKPVMYSMEQQADAVFLLSHGWGTLWKDLSAAAQWPESKQARWKKAVADSQKKLKEENAARRKKGMAPRVHASSRAMVRAYFPSVEQPPAPKRYTYTPKDMTEAMAIVRKKSKKRLPLSSGISKKSGRDFSVNVIHFVKKSGAGAKDQARFKQLARGANGEYRTLSGFDAIKSAASEE